MRWINKKTAPSSFLTFIKKTDSTFGTLSKKDKNELRQSLIKEQFGVCAYCQQKLPEVNIEIEIPKVKIEHHCEQTICNGENGSANLTLEYKNLFAVCLGKGSKKNSLHCDSYKANLSKKDGLPMQIIPTKKSHINTLSYSKTGLLNSSNQLFQKEIDEILRLNILHLKEMRKIKWLNFFRYSKAKNGKINLNKMKKLLEGDLAQKENEQGNFTKYINHFPGLSEFMLNKFCSKV